MKKGLRFASLLAVCLFSLTSCGEASFADFKSKASAALEKEVEYTKGTVSGTYVATTDTSKTENKISADLLVSGHIVSPAKFNASDVKYAAMVTALGLSSYTVTEDTDAKYYAGNDFKFVKEITDDDGTKSTNTINWNENGLLTSYEGVYTAGSTKAKYKITVSYSK